MRRLGGWRCLGTLSFDPGIWAGHTCTPPHCHHSGLPASEFCTIWRTLFSKYNVVSTSETSSDLCHCLKHSLAPRPSHPRLQNAVQTASFWRPPRPSGRPCPSQSPQGRLLAAQCRASAGGQAWVLSGPGSPHYCPDPMACGPLPSFSASFLANKLFINDFRNWKGWEEEPLSHH